jgi:enolase-phosphatase E1
MKRPAAIVTDIEGATSSLDFVHKVLFPYARRALPDYVRKHQRQPGIAPLIQQVREASGERAAETEEVIATLLRWMDEDRKATPLKALQGLVWERGYLRGDFTGHIYDDAVRKLREWHDAGIRLYVYSSGSVQAQQLLFGYSDAGDLRPLFSGYFDTRTGHKREPAAYKAIVENIGLPAADILFLSDVIDELDAASAAGLRTILVLRDAVRQHGQHPSVHDFDEIIF